MRLSKIIIVAVVVILSYLMLFGCSNPALNTVNEDILEENEDEFLRNKNENIEESQYLIDEHADELFEELFQLTNLKNHEAYIFEDTLNVLLQFSSNMNRQEVHNSRAYIINAFVTSKYVIGAVPYIQAIGANYDYNGVNFTMYMENDKILKEIYSKDEKDNTKIDYYENLDLELNARTIRNKILNTFARKVKWNYWSVKDVIFEETFKGTVLSVKLKRNKNYDEEEIAYIQTLIEEDLAPKVDYLGIVLQLYSDDEKKYENTYHIGHVDNKYWFEEYWGNHNYFDFDS